MKQSGTRASNLPRYHPGWRKSPSGHPPTLINPITPGKRNGLPVRLFSNSRCVSISNLSEAQTFTRQRRRANQFACLERGNFHRGGLPRSQSTALAPCLDADPVYLSRSSLLPSIMRREIGHCQECLSSRCSAAPRRPRAARNWDSSPQQAPRQFRPCTRSRDDSNRPERRSPTRMSRLPA